MATFSGVADPTGPATRTTWMAAATVRQSVQDEYATAVLVASTSPVTFFTEKASLKTDFPSLVLVATAVLSWLWASAGEARKTAWATTATKTSRRSARMVGERLP